MTRKLILPDTAINPADSYQYFLDVNKLRGIMDFNNPEHLELLNQWNAQVKTFKPHQFMGISPNNGSFNHY
jgi:hypothetical protein